jgi:DNA mismatch repair protein MutS
MQDLTPMLRQYFLIKEEYPDCILFFRMGDFYEMFGDDAHLASKVMEIALTTRDKNKENPVPMCGVPYHAADTYIAKLLKHGYKVAICEQVEDPAKAKGIVKREVVRVVTPGLITDVGIGEIDSKENNYIVGITHRDGMWGAAFLDFSTGGFKTTEVPDASFIIDEINKLGPAEAVMAEDLEKSPDSEDIRKALSGALINYIDPASFAEKTASRTMSETFGITDIDGLGLKERPLALSAAGGLLRYVSDQKMQDINHISYPKLYIPWDFLVIDDVTKRNLELFRTIYEGTKSGSLLSLLDHTKTSMGGRLIRDWMNYPLFEIEEINARHNAVEEFAEKRSVAIGLSEMLKEMADLERISGRISLKSAGARDLVTLSESLKLIPRIINEISTFNASLISRVRESFVDFSPLTRKIDDTILESPPISLKDGGLIRDGVNKELDELRDISRKGKDWIIELEAKERKKTGIAKLKVRFNKVFGYYIEVTKSQLDLVPKDYIRKQTLVGAERYITPELKEFEDKVLGAEEKIKALEYDIFSELRGEAKGWIDELKKAAASIAVLDVLINLSLVATDLNFTRPKIDNNFIIDIKGGRHPMVEAALPSGTFVPNDVYLDSEANQLLIITGPNMAGKSTIIRQVAIIVLMAQIGCFVPADSARIGITDRIFTRVGASDSIARGQSTFMVEMVETANILNNATERSLVILDEIGRGTSTFDGISIAWAVAEYIHDSPGLKPRTLFATHYHELTELSTIKERAKNFNIAVKEWNDRIIFLRRMEKGASSHSYGIEVARLAGLPTEVIDRAKEILTNLERGEFTSQGLPTLALGEGLSEYRGEKQLDLFSTLMSELVSEIKKIDIHNMTPIDAISFLDDLIKKIKKIDTH